MQQSHVDSSYQPTVVTSVAITPTTANKKRMKTTTKQDSGLQVGHTHPRRYARGHRRCEEYIKTSNIYPKALNFVIVPHTAHPSRNILQVTFLELVFFTDLTNAGHKNPGSDNRIHLSCKETQAKELKMRDYPKRGKTSGKESRCPANIQNQGPRHISEAIFDSSAQVKPPQPTPGKTETSHPHWALLEFLIHRIINNKMFVILSH
ncbi:uncharacterized protein [Canis lupus baileyi]|uniref:uncharacterized protein LOC111093476 isoform X1 n=1 Tax=Canis lupus familiaris TaxID=9615 RepID=UPI000BAA3202|nr:uncharacterized protein LOC111093476 isoform X1 [Canis lupus familiaris]XP_038299175.1 uncharacterized protein LOC111093476 isoform X1 [Canis lupus familiaris]|eukprot:XP_022268959.1 uncharacterized protein LOC111093476 isoform X1 [Canis lupus familiaris]